MSEIVRKYSKEWFVSEKNQKQRESLINMQKCSYYDDIPKESLFDQDILSGTKEEVIQKYQNCNDKAQKLLIDSVGGAETLFDIIDENGDGTISAEELRSIASADRKEKDVITLEDIDVLYNNAKATEGATLDRKKYIDTYQYKDGSVTQMSKDKDGNIIEVYTKKPQGNGTASEQYENTFTETVTNIQYDNAGRVKEVKHDAPGNKDDKTIQIAYDDETNTRTVQKETAGRTIKEVYVEDNLVSTEQKLKYNANRKIDNKTEQQTIGNCWVLAGVNSLNSSKKGQKIIKETIVPNDDGSVTVKLKGAKREYTFTPEEIGAHDYTDLSLVYSTGDIDMNLIEMAINEYRKELSETNISINPENPSKSGYTGEAVEYLTGETPEYHSSESDIKKILNHKKLRADNYILQVQFKEEDRSLGDIVTNHGYSISKVTKDKVYVVNPWDSSVEIEYPRDKFMKNARSVSSVYLK